MDTAEQDMVPTTALTTPAAAGYGGRIRSHLLQVPAMRLLVAQPKSLTRLRRCGRLSYQVPTARKTVSGISPNSAVEVEPGTALSPSAAMSRREEPIVSKGCSKQAFSKSPGGRFLRRLRRTRYARSRVPSSVYGRVVCYPSAARPGSGQPPSRPGS